MKKLICFAVVLFLFVLGGSAFASNWDSSMGVFGTSSWDGGSAPSWIQSWLNTNGYSGINASTDYVISTTPFYWTGNGYPTNFTIQEEVAGYKDQNTVGFYQGANYAQTQIFAGPDSQYVNMTKLVNLTGPFGLYIHTPEGNTFYSDRFLNGQQTGVNNAPQVLIYTLKNNSKWLVAFEDLNWASGDKDFNDHMLTMTATPEPISASLFLLGGAGLAIYRKRNKA
jgi:hypothetical protein